MIISSVKQGLAHQLLIVFYVSNYSKSQTLLCEVYK